MPVVPTSVRALAPSTSLDLVWGDQVPSLKSHAELQQAWSSRCRRILHACASSTTLKPEDKPQRCQASSGVTSGARAMHADLLLESWNAYTLTRASPRPVSRQQAEKTPRRSPGVVNVASNGRLAGASSISPAMHQGFLRKMGDALDPKEAQEFHQVSILVDSGSQQEPLCSTAMAQRLGLQGTFSSYAVQAGGQPLPIYDVGWCELGINGKPCKTRFKSAALSPFDVILGESWLRQHGGVLDYADNTLWQKGAEGNLTPLTFDMPAPTLPPHVVSGARVRRLQRRHIPQAVKHQSYLQAVLDFAKELPEDGELEFDDIPGIASAERTSFSFVEDDVRIHLAHLPAAQVEEVVQRLRMFEEDVFETRTQPRPPPMREFDVSIAEKEGSTPPARRPYPVAPHHQPELDRQIKTLLEAGIIRRSFSPYSSPVLFTPKKDGTKRMVVDYRMLNAQTIRDRFPTPTAGDLIAKTRGAKLFSKIDLQSGFHQLRMSEQDAHKTAFATPSGLYEFVSAPFGLTSVPGAFQRFMQFVLADHIAAGYCVVYCDDIAIFSMSDDPMVHLQHVEAVLASLREHQLLAKGSKCEFMRREAEFLGFMVSGAGVRPVPSKIEAVVQIPVPETISHLRSFLGMCNFFRSHIPSFSEISAPLTELLKGSKHGRQRLAWNLASDHAFAQLKELLTTAPLLRHFDPTLRTAVHIDASQHAVGAVLLQWEDGEVEPRPVCFLSRKLQGAQWHYDARNAEALAAQVALAAWRTLLYGVQFELISDHASLRYLFQQKNPSARILRLCEFLAGFDFQEVQSVRGTENVVPDFLSRPWREDVVEAGLHVLSHPRAGKASTLTALGVQPSSCALVLPISGSDVAVFHDGRSFSLPMVSIPEQEESEVVVGRLVKTLLGMQDAVLSYVGAWGGVELWRVDVAATMPRRALLVEGLHWRHAGEMQHREQWRRAHFDALRLFGVLPSMEASKEATGVASLAAITASAPSNSLLPDLLGAQQKDPFLQQVMEGVRGSDDGTWRDFFCNQEGFLCYQRDGDAVPRLCVPKASRDAILHAAHGEALVGHPGVTRTAANIAQFFWWPNLFRDVGHFVRSCRTCATAKNAAGLQLGVDNFSSVPVQPFSHWSMDLIGPLPKSRSGNDLILTWVDRTSKMIVARALRQGNSSAKALAELTFEAICCRFGLPARLTHDNDVRFRSLWKELWRLLNTKITCTSAYNPQADPAERANRQVLEALRAAVASVTDFDQWDQALPHLCFGLNTHPSSATNTSPFELAHGFPARVPLTLDLAEHARLSGDRAAADYALVVHNRHQAAADSVAAAQVRLGRMMAQRAKPAEVKPGDQMYLDASPQHSPPHQVPYKLANRWMGPFAALEVRGPVVRLNLPPELGKISPWVHVRRLKFFEQRDADFSDFDAPAVPMGGDQGVLRYEIHRVWGHRPPNTLPAKEYLVQWKGYDTSQMTWVPRATLAADVPGILAAYEAAPTTATARPSAPKRAQPLVTSPQVQRRSPRLVAA